MAFACWDAAEAFAEKSLFNGFGSMAPSGKLQRLAPWSLRVARCLDSTGRSLDLPGCAD
jgi:hypothetical protein